MGFWSALARFILRNRTFLLILIAAITFALSTQWDNMRFSTTEANLLPDDHYINIEYNKFLEEFGEEGNLVILGIKDSTLFTPEKFIAWNKLSEDLMKYKEIDFTISVGDLLKLEKRKDTTAFKLVPFIKDSVFTNESLKQYKYELFNKLPFYEGLVYSPNKQSIRTAIYVDKSIINTSIRKDFIPMNLGIGLAYTKEIDEYNKVTFALDLNKLLVPSLQIASDSTGKSFYFYPEKTVVSGMMGSVSDAPGGFKEELTEFTTSVGMEYWYQNQFALRAGYFYEDPNKGARKYYTIGAGIKYNVMDLNFSYLRIRSNRRNLGKKMRIQEIALSMNFLITLLTFYFEKFSLIKTFTFPIRSQNFKKFVCTRPFCVGFQMRTKE